MVLCAPPLVIVESFCASCAGIQCLIRTNGANRQVELSGRRVNLGLLRPRRHSPPAVLCSVSAGRRRNLVEGLSSGHQRQYACSFVSASSISILRLASPIGASAVSRQQRKKGGFTVFAVENENSSSSGDAEAGKASVEALEARLGLGRRARKQGGADGVKSKIESAKPKTSAKSWDSMDLAEKVWSLYIDPDKGILFWLNKLAYGAIFTVIGAWIVFRFIGPALGWYELDQPLMSPDRLLDGAP